MITLINYGLGNIRAFTNTYKKLGINLAIADSISDLTPASKLILPGVGAFDHAMQKFSASGMRETISNMVLEKNIPVLGVCVGMQMLADYSEEGNLPGLGWIKGAVKKFNLQDNPNIRLPHMGWNNLKIKKNNPICLEQETSTWFYFLHSYYFECANLDNSLATANYGIEFSAAINHKNIYGVQFHPEKSLLSGADLLNNFARL